MSYGVCEEYGRKSFSQRLVGAVERLTMRKEFMEYSTLLPPCDWREFDGVR